MREASSMSHKYLEKKQRKNCVGGCCCCCCCNIKCWWFAGMQDIGDKNACYSCLVVLGLVRQILVVSDD